MSENVSVSSSSLWDQSRLITDSVTLQHLIVLESCMLPLLDLNEADTIMPTTEDCLMLDLDFNILLGKQKYK